MAHKILTVYIGRFQPFHNGHAHVLERALSKSQAVLVLVGSSYQARTIKNPFTFQERAQMIRDWVNSTKLYHPAVRALRDQPYNDTKWIQSVQEQVDVYLEELGWHDGEYTVHLTGSDRDESTWYLNAFPQWKLDLREAVPAGEDLSATRLREKLFLYSDWRKIDKTFEVNTPAVIVDFLNRFVQTPTYRTLHDEYLFIEKYKQGWSVAPYPPSFLTVDAVVIQSGHVLVVERGALPGKGLWALPGGFVKPKQTLLQALTAEIVEETGLKVPPQVLIGSIKAKEDFDAPDRSLRGRTVTKAYVIRLDDTKPLPKVKGQFAPPEDVGGRTDVVETADAFWLPINEARAKSEYWFEDHHAILDWALGTIKD